MAQRDSHADPYLVSGRSAAGQSLLRMKCDALQRSIDDADALERRGHGLIRRSARLTRVAWAALAVPMLAAVLMCVFAATSHDGTYEGLLAGNWAMLGFFVCIGILSFASSWYTNVRRLRETGQRLLRRAEYQRRIASYQLTEIEHAAVR